MNGKSLSMAIIIAGVVCLLIAIYYIIPGFPHILTTSDPTSSHLKHSLVFLALAIFAFVGSRFARNAA
jgi:hypothetical protein